MRPIHSIGVITLVGILGAVAGFLWQHLNSDKKTDNLTTSNTVETVQVMPEFHYPDIKGRNRSGSEWTNKVLVLNFWATWCPPCRAETPLFIEMQQKYDGRVQFVGIAVDDAAPVMAFAEEFSVNYPLLLGDLKAVGLSQQLGNRFRGLPFTAVARPGGKIEKVFTGEVHKEQLDPLLERLAGQN